MGYCTVADITNTIAQTLTSATADTTNDLGSLSNLLNIGNELDKNLIPDEVVDYYIQLADNEIDGILSELYSTPFTETVTFEGTLYSEVSEYNPYIVLERNSALSAGDIVLLIDASSGQQERHVIEASVGIATYSTVTAIPYYFPENTRILRLSYPPPIRFISARLASAAIYDKYWAAEASPNTSKFGESMRAQAHDRLNDVLKGTIVLHGQHRVGRRFVNPNLIDQYGLPNNGDLTRNPAGR